MRHCSAGAALAVAQVIGLARMQACMHACITGRRLVFRQLRAPAHTCSESGLPRCQERGFYPGCTRHGSNAAPYTAWTPPAYRWCSCMPNRLLRAHQNKQKTRQIGVGQLTVRQQLPTPSDSQNVVMRHWGHFAATDKCNRQ